MNLVDDVTLRAVGSSTVVVKQAVGATNELFDFLDKKRLPVSEKKTFFLSV